jgi:eukaryotic-like serine/threonine-protein kinase
VITGSGHRLGERYVLEERLAVGGMGEVWRARDEVLGRDVAVKILRLELAPDVAFQARFRAEARTAAGLSHGGIAAVYDYGEALQSAFLVMELVPGEPLSAMIARDGALGTDRTLTIVAQAARALHAAHLHGVVHRDIKPANLMVTPELRVKITDFGISRPRDHEPLTATGQVMGTAHYLAPELARGEVATPLSDVYALGIVTYECLAGWRPFEGDNQVAVATAQLTQQAPPLPDTVPLPVRQLVASAMAKNPHVRPQGAKAFALALEDLRLRQLASTTLPSSGSWPSDADTPPGGVSESRSGAAGAAGAAAAGAAAGLGAAEWGAAPRPAAATPADRTAERGSPQGDRSTPADLPERSAPDERPGRRAASGQGGGHAAPPSPKPAGTARAGSRSESSTPRTPTRGPAHGPSNRALAAGAVGGTRRSGPPTAALPGDRDPTRPGGEGSRRLPVPLLALAGLIAVVVVGALLLNNRGDDKETSAPPTQPAATASSPAATPSNSASDDGTIGSSNTGKQGAGGPIIVAADELVGEDIDDVREWLDDNDVSYRIVRTADDADAGDVIDVSPTGTVELGQRVTVTVSSGPG